MSHSDEQYAELQHAYSILEDVCEYLEDDPDSGILPDDAPEELQEWWIARKEQRTKELIKKLNAVRPVGFGRPKGIPSRAEMYDTLKRRSEEIQAHGREE